MKCTTVQMPGGGTAIVCTSGKPRRCGCGAVATLLCDGSPPTGANRKTCDAPLCGFCTTKVLGTKHLPGETNGTDDTDLCRRCAGPADTPEGRLADAQRARVRLGGAPGVDRCACGALGVRKCRAIVPTQWPQVGDGRREKRCGKPLCDACAVPLGARREACREHAG